MTLRKVVLLAFALSLYGTTLGAANRLYLDTLTVNAGDTARCRVHLRNDTPVRSVQFDLTLSPANGLTFLQARLMDSFSGWTLSRSLHNGVLRVILYKMSSETIASGDTTLLSLEYSTPAQTYTKDFNLILSGVSLVDAQVQPVPNQQLGNGTICVEGDRPAQGDLDGSGKVDVFDLLGVLRVMSGKQNDRHGFSDLDGNGKVDVFDLLALLRMLAGK